MCRTGHVANIRRLPTVVERIPMPARVFRTPLFIVCLALLCAVGVPLTAQKGATQKKAQKKAALVSAATAKELRPARKTQGRGEQEEFERRQQVDDRGQGNGNGQGGGRRMRDQRLRRGQPF